MPQLVDKWMSRWTWGQGGHAVCVVVMAMVVVKKGWRGWGYLGICLRDIAGGIAKQCKVVMRLMCVRRMLYGRLVVSPGLYVVLLPVFCRGAR